MTVGFVVLKGVTFSKPTDWDCAAGESKVPSETSVATAFFILEVIFAYFRCASVLSIKKSLNLA